MFPVRRKSSVVLEVRRAGAPVSNFFSEAPRSFQKLLRGRESSAKTRRGSGSRSEGAPTVRSAEGAAKAARGYRRAIGSEGAGAVCCRIIRRDGNPLGDVLERVRSERDDHRFPFPCWRWACARREDRASIFSEACCMSFLAGRRSCHRSDDAQGKLVPSLFL